MNLTVISLAFLRRRRLSGLLSVCLLGFGLGTIDAVLLFSHQLRDGLERNIGGIDLVVGAKGSPLQLILSSIFHADTPTGNIPLDEARKIASRRGIHQAIPVALGDSYESHRIVGTQRSYAELYDASLSEGRWWSSPLEVVIGDEASRETGLSLGDTFASIHGYEPGGHHHEERMRVVGVMNRSGAVLDRLILTSVETVWQVHGIHAKGDEHDEERRGHEGHGHKEHGHEERRGHEGHGHEEHEGHRSEMDVLKPGPLSSTGLELTAMLIQYTSPVAAATFPMSINKNTVLQAASPAFETARLFSLIGVGVDTLRAFGMLLAFGALLGVFVLLHEQLSELLRDLGVLRLLGLPKEKLLGIVILQGVMLGSAGSICGLVLGHAGLAVLNVFLSESGLGSTGNVAWLPIEFGVLLAGPVLGATAAFAPAWGAYRTQISPIIAGD